MVVYVGVGVVLDEVETLLSAVGVFHRLTELVEADVSRAVDHAPVPQIRAVVYFVKLAHRSLLLLRLKVNSRRFVIYYPLFFDPLLFEIIRMHVKNLFSVVKNFLSNLTLFAKDKFHKFFTFIII